MLVKVLCGHAIATRRRLPREGNVTFKDLMRGASDLDVRTVTLEIVTSLRYLLPITVGIITVITPMRSVVLSCSHETFCIDGEVGSLSNESVSKTSQSGSVAPLFCAAPALLRRYARWGRPYFQQFFDATPAESGLIVTGSLLNPRRIKDLGGCGYHKASFWRCHLMSELETFLLRGTEGSNPSLSSGEFGANRFRSLPSAAIPGRLRWRHERARRHMKGFRRWGVLYDNRTEGCRTEHAGGERPRLSRGWPSPFSGI